MPNVFAAKPDLRDASRVRNLSGMDRISAVECLCLFACGAASMLLMGTLHGLRIPFPGNAILRGTLATALGFAVVPRRSAGTLMSIGAFTMAGIMNWLDVGKFPQAAVLSVGLLGPMLDLALFGRPRGWQLYFRFMVGGAAANMLAYSLKVTAWRFRFDPASGHNFEVFGWTACVWFAVFGALAGLISAVIWFRIRVADDLRRN